MWTRSKSPYRWDNSWTMFDEMRNVMNQMVRRGWDPAGTPRLLARGEHLQANNWPQMNLVDRGEAFHLFAKVPGLTQEDIKIEANAESMTISGERKVTSPEGYKVHRQERGTMQFSRSFTFPTRIDVNKIQANLKDGILDLMLPKAEETKPRQIKVQVS